MAAPSFVDASTGATDAGGAWTANSGGAGVANLPVGSVIIFQVLQDGTTADVMGTPPTVGADDTRLTISAIQTNSLAGTANRLTYLGTFNVGSATAALQHLWIGRTAVADSYGQISGANSTSEDLYFRSYLFTDVSTGSTLATVIENGTAGSTANEVGTSATASDAGVTTLGSDRLALNFVAVNDDNAISAFTGETGGKWVLPTDPYAEASGTDGAIALQVAYVGGVYQPRQNGFQGFGTTTGTPRLAQSFVAQGNVTHAGAVLSKNGTPSDNCVIQIQTDSGSDTPSETVLASGSIAGSSLTTSAAWYWVSVSASLTPGTKYWLVFTRSGATSETNYYNLYRQTASNSYPDGGAATYSSGAWSTGSATTDDAFAVTNAGDTDGATINGGTGSIVDSDAWGVVGFALIGTTVEGPVTYVPRHPAHDFGSVTNF